MREVFGERGTPNAGAARAIKPTEVGDAATQANHDKTKQTKDGAAPEGVPTVGTGAGIGQTHHHNEL